MCRVGTSGLGTDLAYSGFAGDFIQDVGSRLAPGGYAVVASLWEDWTVPVDVAVAPFGGAVFRQSTDELVVAQVRASWLVLKDEQQHLDTEIHRATGEAKAKLEAKRTESMSS